MLELKIYVTKIMSQIYANSNIAILATTFTGIYRNYLFHNSIVI